MGKEEMKSVEVSRHAVRCEWEICEKSQLSWDKRKEKK